MSCVPVAVVGQVGRISAVGVGEDTTLIGRPVQRRVVCYRNTVYCTPYNIKYKTLNQFEPGMSSRPACLKPMQSPRTDVVKAGPMPRPVTIEDKLNAKVVFFDVL